MGSHCDRNTYSRVRERMNRRGGVQASRLLPHPDYSTHLASVNKPRAQRERERVVPQAKRDSDVDCCVLIRQLLGCIFVIPRSHKIFVP
jgi:hypothetical protein